MNDLRERLREIERNPSPDLWGEITSRPVQSHANDRRGLRHRVAAGLVAAVVSIAAFAFLVTMFRSDSDQDAVGTSLPPLTIRVQTTNDPSDVHFSATYQGQEIELVGIETPGPDLEYPNSTPVELPVGTPILIAASEGIEGSEGISVSVFELDPAQGRFVVEDGSCLIPGSLKALPGPDETAFFIYAEGMGLTGGQAFRAKTVGEELTHDAAIDPSSTVDAGKLGLATCDSDPPLTGRDVFAEGSDPLLGSWRLFTEEADYGPTFGVLIPGQQAFTTELKPLGDRTFGAWTITSGPGRELLLVQVVAPTVMRAEIRLDDETVIDGELVDLPGEMIGSAKVLVAGFSGDMSVEGQHLEPNGDVVVYGANGQELERRRLAQG